MVWEPIVGFALRSAADLIDPHPDLAKGLLEKAIDFLDKFGGDKPRHPDAVAAAVAGMAAARANAVQEAFRRHPNPTT